MFITELTQKAKSIYVLYKNNLISLEGLNKALQDNIITIEEYNFILDN